MQCTGWESSEGLDGSRCETVVKIRAEATALLTVSWQVNRAGFSASAWRMSFVEIIHLILW